jgi:hypothetical protein
MVGPWRNHCSRNHGGTTFLLAGLCTQAHHTWQLNTWPFLPVDPLAGPVPSPSRRRSSRLGGWSCPGASFNLVGCWVGAACQRGAAFLPHVLDEADLLHQASSCRSPPTFSPKTRPHPLLRHLSSSLSLYAILHDAAQSVKRKILLITVGSWELSFGDSSMRCKLHNFLPN